MGICGFSQCQVHIWMRIVLPAWSGRVSAAQVTRWKAEFRWYTVCINSLVWHRCVALCGCDGTDLTESDRSSLWSRPRTNACVLRTIERLFVFSEFVTGLQFHVIQRARSSSGLRAFLRTCDSRVRFVVYLWTYSAYVWGEKNLPSSFSGESGTVLSHSSWFIMPKLGYNWSLHVQQMLSSWFNACNKTVHATKRLFKN